VWAEGKLVSRTVHSSLDAHEIARLAIALVVPKLGDCAFLWMLDRDGALKVMAWTHADPRKEPIVDDLVRQLAQDPKRPNFCGGSSGSGAKRSVFASEAQPERALA